MRPDKSIKYLKSFGYSVVRLPRTDVKPLQALTRNGKDLNRFGTIQEIVSPGTAALPDISPDQPSALISGQESSSVDISIGLDILGNLIAAMGGSRLGLSIGYKNTRKIVFKFSNVLVNDVSVAGLEKYLNMGSVNPQNASGTIRRLEDDEIYVITSTIKSKVFTVTAEADGSLNANLDVPIIQEAVGGNVKVGAVGDSSSVVSYEGPEPLVFGVQAAQLIFDGERGFTMTKALPAGKTAVRKPRALQSGEAIEKTAVGEEVEDGLWIPFLDLPGAFVRVNDEA